MERKLRYLEREILKDKLEIIDTGENPEAPQPREMIDLEVSDDVGVGVCVSMCVYVWVCFQCRMSQVEC